MKLSTVDEGTRAWPELFKAPQTVAIKESGVLKQSLNVPFRISPSLTPAPRPHHGHFDVFYSVWFSQENQHIGILKNT